MRTNLKPFLARLALIALILLGVNVRLSAHDLPADRSLTENATANCFTTSPAVVVTQTATNHVESPVAATQPAAPQVDVWPRQTLLHYALRQASPALAALTDQSELWKQFGQTSAALSVAWTRIQDSLDATITLPKSSLAIAPPDIGVAPRPQSRVLSVATAKSQLSMAGEVGSSSVLPNRFFAITSPDIGAAPRPQSKILSDAMAKAQPAKAGEVYMPYDFRMSDWRFGQFPYHGKTVSALRPATLPSLADEFLCVPSLALPNTAEETQANPSTRPGEALGKLLQVFEQWQFEMPLDNPCLAGQSRLMQLLGAGLKPIQTSVLATATSGLQRAGQTLLNLSQSLSNISEPRLASGPQADQF